MRVARLPGVFRPRGDTWLLAAVLRRRLRARGGTVLDVCTGSGAIAVVAALAGARSVTAVDVSARAVLGVRIGARLNGVRVEALRGDLLDAVAGRRLDVIVSNPPYLPSARVPTRGAPARRSATTGSSPAARMRSSVVASPLMLECATSSSPPGARCAGRGVDQPVRAAGGRSVPRPCGAPLPAPLLAARAPELEAKGLLARGQRGEELLVLAGAA
jgi:release factor glutamine methyltransferase